MTHEALKAAQHKEFTECLYWADKYATQICSYLKRQKYYVATKFVPTVTKKKLCSYVCN